MKKHLLNYSLVTITGLATMASCRPVQSVKKTPPAPGTTSYTLTILPTEIKGALLTPDQSESLTVVNNINNRLVSLGYENTATLGTDGKIYLNIPSLTPDKEQSFKQTLTGSSRIELRPVHLENQKLLAENTTEVPGYILQNYSFFDAAGVQHSEKLFLTKDAPITNDDFLKIEKSDTNPDQFHMTMTDEGGEKSRELTSRMQKGMQRMAVVVNGQIITAPVIQSNLYKHISINVNDSTQKANKMPLNILFTQRMYPLKFKVEFTEEQKPLP